MILVLTNYRTGSTNFCQYLADENNYLNCDEFFHPLRSNQQEEDIQFIKNNPKTVIKCMPDQLLNAKTPNLLEILIELSEKIYVLLRKDVYNQCKSHYIAVQLSGEKSGDWVDHWHDHFKSTKEIKYIGHNWKNSVSFILDRYSELLEIAKTLPHFELIYTHQIPNSVKYHRPVRWTIEPIELDPGLANLILDPQFEQLNIDINK